MNAAVLIAFSRFDQTRRQFNVFVEATADRRGRDTRGSTAHSTPDSGFRWPSCAVSVRLPTGDSCSPPVEANARFDDGRAVQLAEMVTRARVGRRRILGVLTGLAISGAAMLGPVGSAQAA